jgi:hypothetical protein
MFFTEAMIEVKSNSELGCGFSPGRGSEITVPFATHGETSSVGILTPVAFSVKESHSK